MRARSISTDDLVADLELDAGLRAELIAARKDLARAIGSATGPSLGELRLRLGMSQRELAQRTGLHQPTISALEIGKRTPDDDTARRLAMALEISTDQVYSAILAERPEL